ncbi:MAG: hypothetical protein HN379_09390 [Desulfobacteraceae bacterium]|nr:hypothetical protein [Desulfobacteraceae bacterium]
MIKEYAHQLNIEVKSISGEYMLDKEEVVEYKGKKLLYGVGNAMVDSSCCGIYGCRYALVAGYVKSLKTRKNEHNMWISEVETITDKKTRNDIKQLIEKNDCVSQVNFW